MAADGNLIMQTNMINPMPGKNFISNDINLYLAVNEKFGVGIETNFSPEKDYSRFRPLMTWAIDKNWGLLGGYSVDSADQHHVRGGFSYFRNLGKNYSFLFATSYYLGIDEESKDFTDSYVELKYDFGNKFSLALEIVHDYWPDNGANWLLAGPVLHYKVSDKVDFFGRVALDSDLAGQKGTDLRLGFIYSF